MQLTPGTVIAGRYRLESKIGEGGMGSVWLGEHVVVGVRVAIKTLLPAAACDHEVVARFRREARLLGRIRSDHVARVLDFIEDQAFGLVLVMEFVEGRSLTRVLHEAGRLQVEDAVELAHDIASAIGEMHRAQIVHRDLKPGNILIQTLTGGRRRAVIVDFGMSRLVTQADDDDPEMTGITRADMALGTLEYMAPEAILNSRDVTVASDLYAVGAILYRAVAGHHVFGDAREGELARVKLMQDAPPLPVRRQDRIATGLAAIVARSLRRRIAERYQRADDMLRDLTPLRELVRVASVEIETAETHITTLSQTLLTQLEASSASSLEGMEKTRPVARKAALAEMAGTAPASAPMSGPAPSHPSWQGGVPGQPWSMSAPPGSAGPAHAPASSSAAGVNASVPVAAPDKPMRTGMPYGFAATAILVALSGGVITGAELNRHGVFPFQSGQPGATTTDAESPAASRLPAAAEPPASATPPPELVATAAASAAMTAAPSAAPPAVASALPPPAPTLGPPWPKPAATATADTIPASASESSPAGTASAPAAPDPAKLLPSPTPPTAPPPVSAKPLLKQDPYQ